MTSLVCARCGNESEPSLDQRFVTGRFETRLVIGAFCSACNSWIKWVPQNAEWVGLFNRQHDHPMYPNEKRVLKVTE